ncbi:MAG: glycosyl hydrolase [Deltaproteobacteria bacterium]|nr:glycosyl hydrolase [Deltaproteobacteria bacterium]
MRCAMAKLCVLLIALAVVTGSAEAKKKKEEPKPAPAQEEELFSTKTFSGLELRSIGPALTSGRVSDLAVDPRNRKRYFAAIASGGVWKTETAGTTWTPVFDSEGSYSIGCVALDPNNPEVVWVGTGENNSQRSVGYGDGVYKSLDGGDSWEKVGLENSEHIGKIVIDPRDSDTVFVASQGPLWSDGGDRGLYKTTDGGETWKKVLEISDKTGVSDLVYDPRDPDVLYASTYQRRRHVWTLINGGPESAIYKSTDGGEHWRKLESGLPKGDVGRIGLAVSPPNPDVVYAVIEATGEKGGFFRSTNRGETWEKRSSYVSGSPQYYQELIADPVDVDRVYSMDTWSQATVDGGKTFFKVGDAAKHVDNHALWIDPQDPEYLLMGCDGGIYESFDRGITWDYKANLPVTQFYKIAVDNDVPFYHVYGGTQDNFTLGGPVRTPTAHGITNADWYITVGGDGFQPRIDPDDPNIIYSQSQHGVLVRFDRRTGQRIDIQPQAGAGEPPLVWNWDSPLIISPHSGSRLYFGANKLFRSDNRGDSWTAVSPNLTRELDRNQLPVMGEVWSIDAVAKNRSTSIYGNLVALDESPQVEGLIYAGTDDGLVQITEDGGEVWRKVERVTGVPENTYVNDLHASLHHSDTVYAAFNNHKQGDFSPYLYRSSDRGRTWVSISGDLPARGSVYAIEEDHVDPKMLFAGTEFGVFFTLDGGGQWIQLEGGIPTIAVRDLAIQRQENDLVAGTFGRGFYVLDDYSPLRLSSPQALEAEAALFPVKKTWMYIEAEPLGLPGKSFQGGAFYTAPNPPFGATFTYYLKEGLETREKARQKEEKEAREAGEPVSYPSWDALREEDREPEPTIVLTVKDDQGTVVRRLTGPVSAGFHRVAWDLRLPAPDPVSLETLDRSNPFQSFPIGPLALPGTYSVSLAKQVGGEITALGEPQTFEATPLGTASLPEADRRELLAFEKKTARLYRAVAGASEAAAEAKNRLAYLHKAILETPGADDSMGQEASRLENRLDDLLILLEGDRVVARRYEATSPSIYQRVATVIQGHWTTTTVPTETHRQAYRIAAEAFGPWLKDLRILIEQDLTKLEDRLEDVGAPWTPGRLPRWNGE